MMQSFLINFVLNTYACLSLHLYLTFCGCPHKVKAFSCQYRLHGWPCLIKCLILLHGQFSLWERAGVTHTVCCTYSMSLCTWTHCNKQHTENLSLPARCSALWRTDLGPVFSQSELCALIEWGVSAVWKPNSQRGKLNRVRPRILCCSLRIKHYSIPETEAL